MRMNKALKWVGIVVITPIILFIILALLIYFPPFQNWAVGRVTAYASQNTGMEIGVERVSLEFPLDLGITGFKMIRPNDSLPQVRDTVADVRKVIADIQLLPLFRGKVEINALEFNDLKVNTANFIQEARVKGTVGQLALVSHGIDLGRQTLYVNCAKLSNAKLDVALSDTVPPDMSTTKNHWKIYADKLNVSNADVTIHMPGDTLQAQAYMGKFTATGGYFDLYNSLYKVSKINWTDGRLNYDNNFKTRAKGFDYNHIALTRVNVSIDQLVYQDPKLDLRLTSCSFMEKSGINVKEMACKVSMDSTKIYLPAFNFKTTESSLTAKLEMDLDVFADKDPGVFKTIVHGSFGKQDLMRFMAGMPPAFVKQFPNYPLTIDGVMNGNMSRMDFIGLNVKLPTAFNFNANGYVTNPTDTKRVKADINLKANTYNLDFVTGMLLDHDMAKVVRVPSGIAMNGKFRVNGSKYDADFLARESGGSLKAKGSIDVNSMTYQAKMTATKLQVQHFLPNYGLHPFTGYIDAKGKGLDFLSNKTNLKASARIVNFQYGDYNLDNVAATATVQDGVAHADINSKNQLVEGLITLDALVNPRKLQAQIACDLTKADLYNLRVVSAPLIVSLDAKANIASNLKDSYNVQGGINDIMVEGQKHSYRPENISMDIVTDRDTTHAAVDCGDFHLKMNAKGGYEQLMEEGMSAVGELQKQLKDKYIDQARLRGCLPTASINLRTGKGNMFVRVLNRLGYGFSNMSVDATSSPVSGLNGNAQVCDLVVDSIQVDTVRLNLMSDEDNMTYNMHVHNIDHNPKYTFNAFLDGGIYSRGARMMANIYDAKNKLGLSLGLAGVVANKGIMVKVYGDKPVLGYKQFSVNDSNYVFLGNNKRVYANLQLKADDGMAVQILSDNTNTEALQDVTLTLNKFDLGQILAIIPYAPNITGTMNGDFHVIQTTEDMSVSSDVSINNMVYEKMPMGNLSSEFVYMPKSDGSHYINGTLSSDGEQVAIIGGTYSPNGEGSIDAEMTLDRAPLRFVNGFIPDQIVGLAGYGNGTFTVKGSLAAPQVNGEMYADSAYLVSVPYGVNLRMDKTPIQITGSNLIFKDFKMYSHNNSTLNVSGNYDFSDLNNMSMNLNLRASNYQIIDSKENYRSETFGKAFVNFFGTMRGPVSGLQMRGRLSVLGSTDMTYILRDSPLSTDNQLENLVSFTNFKNPNKVLVVRPSLNGFNMDLSMTIDDNAHIMCALNADKSNYVDITGGGNLRIQYNNRDNLLLTGRYTLNDGEMKYSLPVIPLKTFTIQDGSYIEFQGDAMNPRLNITATEQTKATVTESGGPSRSVIFDCGVVITKTLKDMGLQFTLDAPEDMTMHDQLQTMSIEEQGKLAVTMLTTGMYLASGNTNGFSMNSALSSFLQNQINTISGNALRTLDLSLGMDNTTDPDGSKHTDYSFKFSKRFWNNRLNIIVGGKLSTGGDSPNQNNSFLDNVSFEYRLSATSNKYLRLFYDHNSYDWLEGYIGEYGAGFMWKRKVQSFKDIFSFKDGGTPQRKQRAKRDTTKVTNNEPQK